MTKLTQEQIDGLRSIPLLKNYKNWVTWKLTDVKGASTKIPFIPGTKYQASTNKPENWTNFESALAVLEGLDKTQGIGFVMGGDAVSDHLVSIDLDGCINPNPKTEKDEIAVWALEVIDALDSYVERTPSGMGLRIWVKGEYTGSHTWKLDLSAGWGPKVQIEVFHQKGYVTVTGNALRDALFDEASPIKNADLTTLPAMLKAIRLRYLVKKVEEPTAAASGNEHTTSVSAALVWQDKPRAPLAALMSGTHSGEDSKPFIVSYKGASYEFPSGSEADFRLCQVLAREYNDGDLKDEENVFSEIDGEFRKSMLFERNSKWDTNESRRKHTIAKAIAEHKEWLEEQAPSKVSDMYSSASGVAIWINGPLQGQRLDGKPIEGDVILTFTDRVVPNYRPLIIAAELNIQRPSWIETNVPIPSQIPTEVQRYFINKMIMEHGLHLISGDKGSLKTMFQLMLARALCEGTDLLGRANIRQPLRVVYVDRENPKAEMQRRIRALGLHDLKNFYLWGDWSLTNPPPTSFKDPRFWEQALRHPDTFFMFDSLSSFLEGADESKTGEMLPVMQEARPLARNCAGVSTLHHVAKNRKDQARGAGVIGDQTDMAFVMMKKGKNGASLFDERFRGIESWNIDFKMDWGSGNVGIPEVYTPHVISDSLRSSHPDKSEEQKAQEIVTIAKNKADQEALQASAVELIQQSYASAVNGKGYCIASRRQLIELLGCVDSDENRQILGSGKDKPWTCVPGLRSAYWYLPKGVKEIPTKPTKVKEAKTPKRQAAKKG